MVLLHVACLKQFSFKIYFQIIVPTLHLGLGIFKSIFDKLESDCHDLDVIIYKAMLKEESQIDTNNFYQHITKQVERNAATRRKVENKKEELQDITDDLPLKLLSYTLHTDKPFELQLDDDIIDLLEQKNKLQASIESLVIIRGSRDTNNCILELFEWAGWVWSWKNKIN